MPLSSLDATQRALRVARAQYSRGKGDLRELLRKRQATVKKQKTTLRQLEDKVREMDGVLSEECSSSSSLLGSSSSDSESETDSASFKGTPPKEKASPGLKPPEEEAVPQAKTKAKAKAKAPPVSPKEKSIAKAPRRSKQNFPEIPPGEPAPSHKGKPNAEGVLYPGFARKDPRRCDSCEQLRRGFASSSKKHNPNCAWKVRG